MTTRIQQSISRRQLLAVGAATIPALTTLTPGVTSAQSQPRFGIDGQDAPELDIGYWIDGDGKPDGGVGGFGSLYNLFEREIRQIGENPENQQKLPSEPTEKLNGQYCFANQ